MNAMRVCLYFVIVCRVFTPRFSNILVTSAWNWLPLYIVLKYLRIGERSNLIDIDNHICYVLHLFCSDGSGDFVSGSDVNSRENVLVLITVQGITGHVQVKLMHLIRNRHSKRLLSTSIANNVWLFLTKCSQLLDGFLPFPLVAQLVVNTLELIHFGSMQNNTKEGECTSLGISFS